MNNNDGSSLPEKKQGKKRDGVAAYSRIALDIAHRIVQGNLPEGIKLSGRSLMSSEYGVSPETIRRAFSLLEDMGVVEVRQNSGVSVKSKESARKYIIRQSNRSESRDVLKKMQDLMIQQETINKEIHHIMKQLIDNTKQFSSSNPFYTYENIVNSSSVACGKTLGELRFWHETKATVIAIRRGDSIILSPGPHLYLQANDILVLVGDQETQQAVAILLSQNE